MSDPLNPDLRKTVDDEEREADTPDAAASRPTGGREGASSTVSPGSRVRAERKAPISKTSLQSEGQIKASDDYVIIGPSKSGKTTLLTAIERACQLPIDDGLDLSFAPKEATSQLIREQYRRISEKDEGVPATDVIRDFPFHISVTAESESFWSRSIEADAHIVMTDGPGGHLFPLDDDPEGEQFRREMAERVGKASTIVLCLNVVDLNLTLLYSELSRLLAQTTNPRPIELPISFRERLQDGIGNRVETWREKLDYFRGARRHSRLRSVRQATSNGNRSRGRELTCLRADRFLLLLTQVDKLCELAPDGISPVSIAQMIDPVAQARHLLGPAFLNTLRASVSPNGRMAVGVCSAFGFHPDDGSPFADINGRPLSWTGEVGEELLKNWTPFGVRDAIYFTVTGNCRGTVKELTYDCLLKLSRGTELKVKSRDEGERYGGNGFKTF